MRISSPNGLQKREETEAQRGWKSLLRSHNYQVVQMVMDTSSDPGLVKMLPGLRLALNSSTWVSVCMQHPRVLS